VSHHFISYSTADGAELARKLHDALEGGSPPRSAWMDKVDLVANIDWDVQLDHAIRDCKTLLFLMTEDSVGDSSGCKLEWSRALQYKKPIIPLLIHKAAALPFRLGSRQYIDFTEGFEAGIARLRQHLDWQASPEGDLQRLRDQLADAERDLRREFDATRRARIETDIKDLRDSIARQEAVVRDPQAAAEQTRRSLEAGIERERQPEQRITGQSRSKFINPPPGEAPPYFAGREAETRLLANFLKNDSQRLFTLIGRGGVGKTALVCRLLKGLERGELPDGLGSLTVDGIVYLSENGSRRITVDNLLGDLSKLLTGPAADEAAQLLQNPALATEAKVRGLLTHFDAAGGRVVLLLDNAEDLLDEGGKFKDAELFEALKTLLKAVNRFKIILTSRVRPHELLLVEPKVQHTPREITDGLDSPHAEAILRALDDTGELGLKDAPDDLLNQARLSTRGFPRALEALVAILRADRYTALPDLLERELPDNVTETLVGEAFARLEPTAQAALQVLAVYGRPVTPVAVDYVLHPFHETADSARLLRRLAAMHFVRAEAGNFFLHPVDRTYALGRLPAGEDSDRFEFGEPVFTRIGLAKLAADYFSTTQLPREQWKKLEDLRPQLDEFDLRCESGDWDTAANILIDIDTDIRRWGYARLVIDLHERLENRPLSEILAMVRTAKLAQAFINLGRYHSAIASLNEALLMSQSLQSRHAEGVILGELGRCYSNLGQYAKAIEHLEQALAIKHEIGDRVGEGTILGNMGGCYRNLGQTAKAIDYHQQALAIFREVGNRVGEGATLGNLGSCYSNLGQTAKAIEAHEQALVISREVGDRAGEGTDLGNLGLCYDILGQIAKAIDYHEQALAISREVGNRAGEGIVLGNLGSCYRNLGQYAKAIDYHKQALAIFRQIGDRAGEGATLSNLGGCYSDLGQYDKAVDHIQSAQAIARDIGDQLGQAAYQRRWGNTALLQGDWAEAATQYQLALAIADAIGASSSQHQTRWGLALVKLYTGDLLEARARIDSALTFDEPENTHKSQAALGVIALRQGGGVTARDAFNRAIAHADELLGHSDQNYDAWDTRFIALSGLALLATDPTQRESHLVEARSAYAKARELTNNAPGVVTNVRQLLDALQVADTDGVLSDL